MKKSIKISGLLSALLFAYGAHAAGLGKLSVMSALGQPLKAEIELLSVTKEELSGISAQLASRELFRQARIDRPMTLNGLEFEVAQRASGQPVIRISSATPMADPFLDLLIELNWNTGRIIREYTILLDPPSETRVSQQASTKPAAPTSTTAPAKDATAADAAKAPAEAVKEPSKPVAKAPAAAPSRYGPVKSGETLRGIAGRVKGSEVTLEQMMAGLYMANKSAFISNNMNMLKQGAVLNVPTAESVHLQASPAQAISMIQKHVDEWHAYRGKVADVAAEAPESRADAAATGGKITPKVEDKSSASAAPKDVLKLSKGEPAGSAKADPRIQERLQALEEELAAKARALQESNDRVSQLEQTVKDLQKLLELKAQEAASQPAPVVTPAAPEAAEPATPAAPAAEPEVKPAPAPVTPMAEEESWYSSFLKNPIYIGGVLAALLLSGLLWMMVSGNRRKQGLNKFEDSIMTGGEFKSGAVFNTGGATPTVGAANTEGSMLLTDFSRLGLGAIDTHEVDPIAEAEVYMAYGRDAQAEEILKEALDKDSSRHEIALKLLEIYAARKDPLAFETTASELYAGLGGQDTPVWQRAAEMGREIDPDNPLYRLAQGQSFSSASESSAEVAEFSQVDEQVEAVRDEKEVDLGLDFVTESALVETSTAEQAEEEISLDFAEPLSSVAPEALEEISLTDVPATPEEEEAVSLDFEPVPMETEPEASEFEVMEQPLAEADDLSIDLEMPAPAVEEAAMDLGLEAPSLEPQAESLEFEAPEIPSEVAVEEIESPPELDLSGIDLDLAVEAPEAPVEEVSIEAPAPEMAEPLPDLDMELEAAPAVQESTIDPALWEEVNTKLDLAKAYLEMGDREGAREILQEVAQEGDGNQKAEADRLLGEVG